jgi:DNA-binding response OmpR family regulator
LLPGAGCARFRRRLSSVGCASVEPIMKDATLTAGHRFLLVDADPASSQALAEQLRRVALGEIDVVAEAGIALERAKDYALGLASLPLPDLATPLFLERWRDEAPGTPLLVIAGPEEALDLAAPAIEALRRPLKLSLLESRIAILLARRDLNEAESIGPYRFNEAEKLLVDTIGEREIRLTEKEAAILRCLARAERRSATRELLLTEVWGYRSGVATHTLETHVYRLRQKIETDPARAEILISEPGGYRLAAGGYRGEVV